MTTPTYTLLASNTLASSASSVIFSSISNAYRDLVVVCQYGSASGENFASMRINSDSGSNYTYLLAEGSGSAATASLFFNETDFKGLVNLRVSGSSRALHIYNIMDYSATDKHKPLLLRANSANSRVTMSYGRWQNTAVVNSVEILANFNQFVSGSSFHLYGIVS